MRSAALVRSCSLQVSKPDCSALKSARTLALDDDFAVLCAELDLANVAARARLGSRILKKASHTEQAFHSPPRGQQIVSSHRNKYDVHRVVNKKNLLNELVPADILRRIKLPLSAGVIPSQSAMECSGQTPVCKC